MLSPYQIGPIVAGLVEYTGEAFLRELGRRMAAVGADLPADIDLVRRHFVDLAQPETAALVAQNHALILKGAGIA